MNIDPQAAEQLLRSQLEPWYKALADPPAAQETVLHRLLSDYAKTNYGKAHGAPNIQTLADYRQAFPIADYEKDYKPLIERVMTGDIEELLCEQPVGWAITRGTTKGESKFIPMTPTDLQMRVSAGRGCDELRGRE